METIKTNIRTQFTPPIIGIVIIIMTLYISAFAGVEVTELDWMRQIEAPKDSVIMAATYRVSSALRLQAPEVMLEAFDACLNRILRDLEADLRQKL